MKNYVEIIKIGIFYNVFNEDCLIINSLFDYKIINNRVGFPINTINKVVNILVNNKVNYVVYNKDKIVDEYSNKDNKYYDVLLKAKSYLNINIRFNNIISNLYKLDKDKLNKIICYIEAVINE